MESPETAENSHSHLRRKNVKEVLSRTSRMYE